MKAPLSYVPALPAAAGLMAGIVIYYCGGESIIWAVLSAIAGITLTLLKKYWPAFMAIFCVIGYIAADISRPTVPSSEFFGQKHKWIAVVENVSESQQATSLTLKVGNYRCMGVLPNIEHKFRVGDSVRFTSKLEPIDQRKDLPDEKSFIPQYFVDGISALTYISPDKIVVFNHRTNLTRWAEDLRDDMRDLIYLSPISSPTAWFLSATLLGDDSMLDGDVKEEFRATGTAHYLALSGFHVGIIAMLASLALWPMKTWSHAGRYRHLFVIALIWVYAFMCGLSASLVRAAVLISIFLMAKVLQRQSSPFNSLAIAAIVILIVAPRQLFAPGFQMSFAAVLSILIFTPALNPFPKSKRFAYGAMQYVAVTIAAMLGTCLITMVHFHRFPLMFLLPNIALGLAMPLLLGAGIILMISTALGIKFTVLGTVVDLCYTACENLCYYFSSLAAAEISGIFLPAITVAAGSIAILLFGASIRLKHLALYVFAVSAAIVAISTSQLNTLDCRAELYVTRQKQRTDIVVRNGTHCLLLTSAPTDDHAHISSQLSRRYCDFLSRRKCNDSLTVSTVDFNLGALCRKNDVLTFGNKTIIIAFSPEITCSKNVKADYLLLTRAAGKDAASLIDQIQAREILISADMPHRRAEKIAEACATRNIPCRHLKEKAFSLKL